MSAVSCLHVTSHGGCCVWLSSEAAASLEVSSPVFELDSYYDADGDSALQASTVAEFNKGFSEKLQHLTTLLQQLKDTNRYKCNVCCHESNSDLCFPHYCISHDVVLYVLCSAHVYSTSFDSILPAAAALPV